MPRTSMSGQMAKRNRLEVDEASQSTPSTQRVMDQAKKAAESLSANERKAMVAAMVRYLIFSDKKKIPVKKAQIVEHVPGLKDNARVFPVIFEAAKSELNEVFGFDLVEASFNTQRCFLLVNTMFMDSATWKVTEEQMNLLVLVLSVTFMKEHRLKDDELFLFLENLGIERGRKHRKFGDVDKLLSSFVHQRYLVKEADSNQEESKKRAYMWGWGVRAYIEINSVQVIATLARMYDQSAAEWASEFKGMIEMHNEKRAAFIK